MARAMSQTLAWLYDHPPEELARVVAKFYPELPAEILVASLRRYRAAGLWARETRMDPQGFTRLAHSLQSGGFISRAPRYEECVEPFLNDIRSGSD